ncbi:MAG: TatD family hydrolase [Chromatiales bacterium]|jgi:TatD DNase family protein
MFIDSHCHLDRLDLAPFNNDFAELMQAIRQADVDHLLCVSIDLESYPAMLALVDQYPNVSTSVGVHPNDFDRREPSVDELVELAQHPSNVAIGETGLDYFRSEGSLDWQRDRFRTHIRAARQAGKPLIIHTRDAREDTINILREENAAEVGGVMHCFTESLEMAEAAMEMNFYISFSGIVTFKNAVELQEVARKVPLERMLIETDSPYLAPVPYRGKPNIPAYVGKVAEYIAGLRDISVEKLAEITSANFRRLFLQ